MKIDIMTLFPEMINAVMRESIIGRAQDKGCCRGQGNQHPRLCALDKHHMADDAPYGGGRGQVMRLEPLYLCHQALSAGEHVQHGVPLHRDSRLISRKRVSCSQRSTFILVCGHYEGIDQRFIDECVDEEISIGDFRADRRGDPRDGSCGRSMPHGAGRSAGRGSVHGGKPLGRPCLEHPQYTCPENWRGREVPEVLLSGHHANIEAMETRNEPAPHEKGSARPVCTVLSRRISGIRRFFDKMNSDER